MKKIQFYLYLAFSLVILFSSCQQDEDSTISKTDQMLQNVLRESGGIDGLQHFLLPKSKDFNKIPQDPKNPLNGAKVELGKKLFYETGLAINSKHEENMQTYSCASCHVPGNAFQAGMRQGIGDGGTGANIRTPNSDFEEDQLDIQPIRTPTVLNSAFNRTTLWNGQFGAAGINEGTEENWTENTPKATNNLGYHGVETQAIAGMAVHRLDVNMTLIESTYYKDLFDFAFPDFEESERYTLETIGLALAAYERTVLANQAPFQDWLKGDLDAMTTTQKQGALLFFGKAKCNTCHSGPALNSEQFFAIGMGDLEGDDCVDVFAEELKHTTALGRGGFTGNSEDNYKFKTPQLYSLKMMKFLGHGSTFTSIKDVIAYKNKGIPQKEELTSEQLAAEFQPLGLTEEEIDQLTDFVENALNDDQMERYVPSQVASGNCFPNNDPQSRAEQGCE